MTPTQPDSPAVEPDDRFPSGPWTGYFLQPSLPGKHGMELILTFRDGVVVGEGRDWVGEFRIKGRYQVVDGKCWWTKAYLKKHAIAYQGYNEGKGIWGTWEYDATWKGGFYIWPVAMGDPTQLRLAESIEEPASTPPPEAPVAEPVGVPAEVAEPVSGESGLASAGRAAGSAVDAAPAARGPEPARSDRPDPSAVATMAGARRPMRGPISRSDTGTGDRPIFGPA